MLQLLRHLLTKVVVVAVAWCEHRATAVRPPCSLCVRPYEWRGHGCADWRVGRGRSAVLARPAADLRGHPQAARAYGAAERTTVRRSAGGRRERRRDPGRVRCRHCRRGAAERSGWLADGRVLLIVLLDLPRASADVPGLPASESCRARRRARGGGGTGRRAGAVSGPTGSGGAGVHGTRRRCAGPGVQGGRLPGVLPARLRW